MEQQTLRPLNPVEVFNERKEQFYQTYLALNRKYNSIAVARITLFIISIMLVVIFANYRLGVGIGIVIVVFPFVFGLIVRYHNRIAQLRDLAHFTALINQQEIDRLDNRLSDLDRGEGFKNKQHPYLHDLDIFGHNSVYQLISRAVTPSGKGTLAGWLSTAAPKEQILLRQEAVKVLTPMVDWRQTFQASGMQRTEEDNNIDLLLQWINEPNRLSGKPWYKLAAFTLPVITISLILMNIFFGLSIYFTVAILVISGLILKKFAKYVENIAEKTSASIKVLQSYGRMIRSIETLQVNGGLLADLQAVFIHHGHTASASILRLQKILDYLQARSNMFYLFFNFILLFDLHLVLLAEKWKKQQKGDVNLWFESIGNFEALTSLAGFAYANPDYTLPQISDKPYVFRAEDLGHPLIPLSERVANRLEMEGRGAINIITGSNMSGKSTFLRTVGVNTVLALAGAPVCASAFTLAPFQLFTSMRTEDNLEEHVSSFYAELRRIKMLLEMLEQPALPVMFMLDEILKGTNSKDRHAGATALIRQVSGTDALGFVSTHDLELGQLTTELPNVKNYSFNSVVEGDEIIFNYTLEEGLCHSFNASKLMEKIGIKMGEA